MPLYRALQAVSYVNGNKVVHITQVGSIFSVTEDQAATIPASKIEYVGSGSDPVYAPEATFLLFDDQGTFPTVGSEFQIYLAQDSGRIYRWVEATKSYQTVNAAVGLDAVTISGAVLSFMLEGNVVSTVTLPGAVLPSQGGQSGKFLTTDGSNASWSVVALTSEISQANIIDTGHSTPSSITGRRAEYLLAHEAALARTLTNKTLVNPTLTGYTETVVALGLVGTSKTLSLASGSLLTATLTASTSCTFTMPTAVAGASFTLYLKQDPTTGNGAATFTGVKWSYGYAPSVSPDAGKMDIYSFMSDGTNWYGSAAQGYSY